MKTTIIEQLCEQIKKREISYAGDLVGIILTGSFAREVNHPNSDIDLHIIVKSSDKLIQYICKVIDNTVVQLQIYSFEKFQQDCLRHERRRPAIYACRVKYDPYNICKECLEMSQEFLDKGPIEMTASEKQILLTKIKTEVLTAAGLIKVNNYVAASLIIDETLQLAINYYNDAHHYWMTNNNYLFNELKKHNVELGNMADEIILCKDVSLKINMLQSFCRKCIPDFDNIGISYSYEERY